MFEKERKLFVIVPVFNEEENVVPFYSAINLAFTKALEIKDKIKEEVRGVEVIFVDDGSSDSTLKKIKELTRNEEEKVRVNYVSFSKNYGKESAFLSGFLKAKKLSSSELDLFSLMDVDLQDLPLNLFKMCEILLNKEEVDRVYAIEKRRDKESKFHKFCALSFYKVFSLLTGLKKLKGGSRDFSVFRKSVLLALLNEKNPRRFFKGSVLKIGFNEEEFLVDSEVRKYGSSKFNFVKLFHYALTGINASTSKLFYLPSVLLTVFTFIITTILFCYSFLFGLLSLILLLFSFNAIFFTFLIVKMSKENIALHSLPFNVKEESKDELINE